MATIGDRTIGAKVADKLEGRDGLVSIAVVTMASMSTDFIMMKCDPVQLYGEMTSNGETFCKNTV